MRDQRRLPHADRALDERREPEAPEPELLNLQRTAGNAAVSRLLSRQGVTSLGMRKPPTLGDLTAGVNADYSAAMGVVYKWFDEHAREAQGGGGGFIQSVPELVAMASDLPFTKADGAAAVVHDTVKPGELELGLRERAKTIGVRLLDHRDMSDVAGRESEIQAALKNLDRIPTSVTFGGDSARVTATITGTVTAEAKVGGAKIEAEGSPGGAKATVSGSGGSAGVEVSDKAVKAELKAGDFVTVEGEIAKQADGSMGWRAEIAIGTLGTMVTPEDVAKVMGGAQETFSQSAGALVRGLGDPDTLAVHGGALAGAVSEVAEKARKSAAQARSGWSVGARVEGGAAGGVSGSVTLTWVF